MNLRLFKGSEKDLKKRHRSLFGNFTYKITKTKYIDIETPF